MQPGSVTLALSFLLVGCAAHTVVSNEHQVVVEASNVDEAVSVARAECKNYGDMAFLQHSDRWLYYFICPSKPAPFLAQASVVVPPKAEEHVLWAEDTLPPAPAVGESSRPGAWLQVTAERSPNSTRRTAEALQRRHAVVLGGRDLRITLVPVASVGSVYRACFGYDTGAEARTACRALRQSSSDSFVAIDESLSAAVFPADE